MVNKGVFVKLATSKRDEIVIYAYHGLKRQPASTPLDMRLPYIGLGFVGILSGIFHAVLNYHTQMGMFLTVHTSFFFTTSPHQLTAS
jgi:hypothetical protein